MSLPHMGPEERERFRDYFRAALTGVAFAAAWRNETCARDAHEATPRSLANEAFMLAAGAMDIDREGIAPKKPEPF